MTIEKVINYAIEYVKHELLLLESDNSILFANKECKDEYYSLIKELKDDKKKLYDILEDLEKEPFNREIYYDM